MLLLAHSVLLSAAHTWTEPTVSGLGERPRGVISDRTQSKMIYDRGLGDVLKCHCKRDIVNLEAHALL